MSVDLGMPRVVDLSDRPDHRGLVDRYGRVADDLRLSLTDRCNLRCTYCMPAEGLPFVAGTMTREELVRLARIAVDELGVRSIRLTGGEPLLRKDLVDIVADLAALDSSVDLSLTTNGIGLAERAEALYAAGLQRINISLDTLNPVHAELLSRRALLPRVLEGIEAARRVGFTPIKINAVLMPGINDGEDVTELLEWCLARDLQLRFIEQMPLDADRRWDPHSFVTAASIRELLAQTVDLRPHRAPRDGAPAERFDVFDPTSGTHRGVIGIIGSVTEPFCADCRRTRLTSDGLVRNCLFADAETDLVSPLRAGASDAELADLWRMAMWGKAAGHGIDTDNFAPPTRSMSQIGG